MYLLGGLVIWEEQSKSGSSIIVSCTIQQMVTVCYWGTAFQASRRPVACSPLPVRDESKSRRYFISRGRTGTVSIVSDRSHGNEFRITPWSADLPPFAGDKKYNDFIWLSHNGADRRRREVRNGSWEETYGLIAWRRVQVSVPLRRVDVAYIG